MGSIGDRNPAIFGREIPELLPIVFQIRIGMMT
jgi:hypothetical protein